MKSLILAGALVFAAANLTPAFALGPRASDGSFPPQANTPYRTMTVPHYEWQYGYVGHHARYMAHWVLVR
jgi:hypothetical protein